jgi:hypothetical protein
MENASADLRTSGKIMRKWMVAAALMVAMPPPAGAWGSDMSGRRWLEVCATKKGFEIVCFGYLVGVADTTQVFQYWFPNNDQSCIPEGTSTTELVAVGRDFISAHPYYHPLPAAWGLSAAFNRRWPCTK